MDYEAHPFEIVKEIMAVADYVEEAPPPSAPIAGATPG